MQAINDAIALLDSLYDNGDLSVDQHAGIMRGIEELRDWIRSEGERTYTCTRDILGGEICSNCRCGAYKGMELP